MNSIIQRDSITICQNCSVVFDVAMQYGKIVCCPVCGTLFEEREGKVYEYDMSKINGKGNYEYRQI